MKVLSFSQEYQGIYEMLYDGVLNTTRPLEAPSETRVVGSILDKFEAIGKAVERGGVASFTLNVYRSNQVVELEDAEYNLMAECLNYVRWTARAARVVTKALEFFNDAASEVRERDGALPANTG